MQLVGDELVILRRDCVEGIVACEDRCPAEAEILKNKPTPRNGSVRPFQPE